MKSACYYIGEQEEDPQEREVDRKDRRKAVFSSGSSKSFGSGSKRFRHAGFKILKAKRCGENTLGSTAFLTKVRFDWPFSNEAQKTGSREKYPASDPKLSFFVRSGNIPEKRDQSKSEKPKILQTQIKRQKRKAGNADGSEETRAQWDGDFEKFKSDGAESFKRKLWRAVRQIYYRKRVGPMGSEAQQHIVRGTLCLG